MWLPVAPRSGAGPCPIVQDRLCSRPGLACGLGAPEVQRGRPCPRAVGAHSWPPGPGPWLAQRGCLSWGWAEVTAWGGAASSVLAASPASSPRSPAWRLGLPRCRGSGVSQEPLAWPPGRGTGGGGPWGRERSKVKGWLTLTPQDSQQREGWWLLDQVTGVWGSVGDPRVMGWELCLWSPLWPLCASVSLA